MHGVLLVLLSMLYHVAYNGISYSGSGTTSANTQRRQDMARILSAFTDYQSNNNGKMPTTSAEVSKFVSRYIGNDFSDPDGSSYVLNAPTVLSEDLSNALGDNPTFSTQGHEIHYYQNAACGSESGALKYMSSERDIAILYVLDDGGIYCGDNQ